MAAASFRLDRVGDGEHGGDPAVDGGEERGAALRRAALGRFGEGGQRRCPRASISRSAPTRTVAARRPRPRTPSPAAAAKAVGLAAAQARAARPPRRSRRRWDVRSAIRPRRPGAGRRPRVETVRAAMRSMSSGRPWVSVPVLSKATMRASCSACSASPLAEQDAQSAARPVPDHDRGRRGEAHGAGAGDDQHRDARPAPGRARAPARTRAMRRRSAAAMRQTTGTNTAVMRSTSAWTGSLRAVRLPPPCG